MTLPKFQEPDWSQLPKEAVAWAVDSSGCAYTFSVVPTLETFSVIWLSDGNRCGQHGQFDLTNIDWRTTLRTRPVEEANQTLKGREVAEAMKLITEGVEDCAEAQRNYELERLAEEFMKALLQNPDWSHDSIPSAAFTAAEAFIAEREKRRNK